MLGQSDWMNAAADSVRLQHQLKRHPADKCDSDDCDDHDAFTTLEDPFDPRTETELIAVDVEEEDEYNGPSIFPSPLRHDNEFVCIDSFGTRSRLAEKAGPIISALFVSASARRSITSQGDNDRMILDPYIEREIESYILDIDRRNDQGENPGRLRHISAEGLEWIMKKIIAPLTHFERSITMENIIAEAVYIWQNHFGYSRDNPGPFETSLEQATKIYVRSTFNDDFRHGPRTPVFYKFIAMPCESYLKHAYGLTMNYSLCPQNAELPASACGHSDSAPFAFGLKLARTKKGWMKWQKYCRLARIAVADVLIMGTCEVDSAGKLQRVQIGDKARPHYRLGSDACRVITKEIMAYLGDDNAIEYLRLRSVNQPIQCEFELFVRRLAGA